MRSSLSALVVLFAASTAGATAAFAQDAPAPVPAAQAAGRMTLPEGFTATLFAGEPDLVQPMAFTFDDRGRVWVVECLSYPQWLKTGTGQDRISIYEDRDGDGRHDSKKVFFAEGTNVSGIALGFGGVWLTCVPNVVFIPDRNGDDVPDGPPEVVLDGFDLNAKHNVLNGLVWGPDGWLYGLNGILSNAKVGKPGTPEAERVAINCGVWRYHPVKKTFEAVAHGTTNPWGLDFDDYGHMFITNCVIKHLFHVVPGMHFDRMFGQHFNPHLYATIGSCADFIHWGGGPWTSSRGGKGEHDKAGGGHAHVGAMVYLADNWPAAYRGSLLTCNLHGNRVNRDLLQRQGSGYKALRAEDLLYANDSWFRGLALQYGPDGGVYVSDWCDTGECHNYVVVDRTNGRLFKIVHGKPATPASVDLGKLADEKLVEHHLHPNDWYVRHARRLLHERSVAGKLSPAAMTGLQKMATEHADATRRLRAIWTLHSVGALDEAARLKLLTDEHEAVRGWAIRLEAEDRAASPALLAKFAELAASDKSALVRLELASALQRLPLDQRLPIIGPLAAHGEDAQDANLPLMIWYATEPLCAAQPAQAAGLIAQAKIPLLREYIARRLATLAE